MRRRPVPYVRALRTSLRTAHLMAFGALYGGHVYGLAAEQLLSALFATVASGAALMGLEIYRTPVWLVQVRGVATFVKIALMASVAIFWDVRVAILSGVIVIGGVSSHMPGQYRYYSVLHRRAIEGSEAG
ncbi:MAG: hypothetical protein A3J75_06255 [Acidobacteria bacterium RBG_16_68_9]|nr:MAG: hypothetical protein A3J75_06255 [Acidobacteria bacterium RBG_16_68_9]